MVFTGFPGLAVRCGRWLKFRLPDCGCDTCDEDPAELWQELEERVCALVSGNFSERLSSRRGVWSFEYDIPGVASGGYGVEYVDNVWGSGWFSSLSGWGARDPLEFGSPGTVEYSAWPGRDGRSS